MRAAGCNATVRCLIVQHVAGASDTLRTPRSVGCTSRFCACSEPIRITQDTEKPHPEERAARIEGAVFGEALIVQVYQLQSLERMLDSL